MHACVFNPIPTAGTYLKRANSGSMISACPRPIQTSLLALAYKPDKITSLLVKKNVNNNS
uniref:Uncharacterized protein n=1 Tax=Anguilla anguilla TaxID=7936 RepID=A0A0E9UN04_ANGAN